MAVRNSALALLMLMASAASAPADAASPSSSQSETRPGPVADGFTFFAAGDLLGPYGSTMPDVDAQVARVFSLIRTSDAAFANHEGNVFDVGNFRGSLAAENGGGYPIHSLEVFRKFREIGLNLISRANNHATDWGVEGMIASDEALDAIGLTHAGTGGSLEKARAPGFLSTSKGRVALIATASTFTGMSPAGAPARGAAARAGLNPLHVQQVRLVKKDEYEALRRLAVNAGWQGYELPVKGTPDIHLDERTFRLAGKEGLTYEVSKVDQDALLKSVGAARDEAGFVVFSIHAHETLSGGYEDPAPADFLQPLFRAAIDAGADAVVRHGPHAVQGIEIYKGRPIFYGLASLFFDLPKTLTIASDGPNKQVVELPDSWYDGAAAVSSYVGGQVKEIKIYPLLLDPRDGDGRGLPRLAQGAEAQRILRAIRDRSRDFGTNIQVHGDIGFIRL
ncbi:CapA family protein [Sphingosinicella sp.]|uniref:CapA family protein n=1 Tax=Sphingosinicella sp. TaxID=1917971 RepID=UPI0035B11056